MNHDSIKEYIKLLLDNTGLTVCKARIDLETNRVMVEFSAMFDYLDDRMKIGAIGGQIFTPGFAIKEASRPNLMENYHMNETSKEVISMDKHNEIAHFFTSGITNAERKLMEEQLAKSQHRRRERVLGEIDNKKDAV